MSHELAASSSSFKKRDPALVPFPSENETHRASSSLVAIKLGNIKVGREALGMFNYNLEVIREGHRDVARWAVGGRICPHYDSEEEGVGGPP